MVDEVHTVDIATGMLMERYHVGPQLALQLLLQYATAHRLQVIDVARRLIATRRLI